MATTIGDAETKLFQCAKVLVGQFVFVQMVGVESSLSLCEVEVFSAGAGMHNERHQQRGKQFLVFGCCLITELDFSSLSYASKLD